MSRRALLLLAVLFLALAAVFADVAFADGGTVLWRKDAGALVITVFATPAPLTAGPVDISLLLQDRGGLDPVLDASVSMRLRPGSLKNASNNDSSDDSNGEIQVRATRKQAQNKLLYAAAVTLPKSGKWQLAVTILRKGERTEAVETIDVATAPKMAATYWSYVAFPPVMIVLFVVRERLIRRRTKG